MLLEMKNIYKSFGAVDALKGVSLRVEKGEVHGLLGENGAGKTTLMNILAGTYPMTSGEIYFEGHHLSHNLSAKKTQAMGIRFIHQELNVINDLTVYENLFLGEELLNKYGLLDKKLMIEKSREVLSRMNLEIDPLEMVGNLETSRKQLVEIAKALLFQAKLIIMDEPTTALNNREIEILFQIMGKLREEGVSMIYISHKMPELFSICDRYTVLRDGNFIEEGYFKDIDEGRATELLVGRDIINEKIEKENAASEILLKVEGISNHGKFKDINFELKKGEVIAITGLHGDGKDFLAEALFGVTKIEEGNIFLKGKKVVFDSVKNVVNQGIAMVQRNRKERSIIKDMSILDNFSMGHFTKSWKNFFVDDKKECGLFEDQKQSMTIKIGSCRDYITSLSGGNQQKVMIARCLNLDSDVIILDNPTQGIDVGAKFEIYKIINDLARNGKGIILFSSEFPEIYKVADRCAVMYKGSINVFLDRDEFNEMKIMHYATGANREGAI